MSFRFLFCAVFVIAGCAGSRPGGAKLSCRISSDKTSYKVGEIPRIKVEIRNLAGKDIYLVRSLYASECKCRYPHCYYEVSDAGGKSYPTFCMHSYPDAILHEDFVRIPAGGAFDPFERVPNGGLGYSYPHRTPGFWRPGEYRVRFTYSSDNPDLDAWWGGLRGRMGREDESVQRIRWMFEQVPKTTVRSNELVLTFVE